jgi:glycosyltransferase involved in cell wall biosynthesis
MIYLSVVTPVKNEEPFIRKTLEMLIHQNYPSERFEIIVVDGESNDATRDIVNEMISNYPKNNIKLLSNPSILSSSGRNIGVKNSQGELIAVIDGHIYIDNNELFQTMERITEEKKALCLARPAPLLAPHLKNQKAIWIAIARKSFLGHSKKSYIYSNKEGFVEPESSGFAYKKELFKRYGYFDENFDAAEDVEFNHRLNLNSIKAYTSPKLKIFYYPRDNLIALMKQQIRYGVGRARFSMKHTKGLSLEVLVIGLFPLFVLSVPLSLLIEPKAFTLSAIPVIIFMAYNLILSTCSIKEALKTKSLHSLFYIYAAIFLIHFGNGYGIFKTFTMRFFKSLFYKFKKSC